VGGDDRASATAFCSRTLTLYQFSPLRPLRVFPPFATPLPSRPRRSPSLRRLPPTQRLLYGHSPILCSTHTFHCRASSLPISMLPPVSCRQEVAPNSFSYLHALSPPILARHAPSLLLSTCLRAFLVASPCPPSPPSRSFLHWLVSPISGRRESLWHPQVYCLLQKCSGSPSCPILFSLASIISNWLTELLGLMLDW
jgi:hypothetical protein